MRAQDTSTRDRAKAHPRADVHSHHLDLFLTTSSSRVRKVSATRPVAWWWTITAPTLAVSHTVPPAGPYAACKWRVSRGSWHDTTNRGFAHAAIGPGAKRPPDSFRAFAATAPWCGASITSIGGIACFRAIS